MEIDKINNTLPEINEETMFISVDEAVKQTGICRNMMLEFARMKGFPAIITTHKIRIDKDMLPVWLRKNYGRYKC